MQTDFSHFRTQADEESILKQDGKETPMASTDTQPLLRRHRRSSSHALELLKARPVGVIGEGTTFSDEKLMEKAEIRGVCFPWMLSYKIWWGITAAGAIATIFFGPFQIAFQKEPGSFNSISDAIELLLTTIFAFDVFVNFNLVFYKNERIVFERKEIATTYLKKMFWVDLIGVFPFEYVALWATGHLDDDKDSIILGFSVLRILRFVRLHRMKKLSDVLQYDARISLLWFTMLRNFAAVLACTHIEACVMYYLARLHDFGEDTWLGPRVADMTGFDRYVTSLYFSITTFATVGYGDWSMSNSRERLWGSVFMLFNVVVAAWVIGSITLLIVKGDEKTGEFRDTLQTLQQYGEMNHFDDTFLKKLKSQLRLEFNNREISDEQVLKNFPSAVRRKILRKLYLQPLVQTELMKGVRPQFVDAFLASCTVEIFSPGEEIVERGSIMSDLFFLVGGVAEITTPEHFQFISPATTSDGPIQRYDSFTEATFNADAHLRSPKVKAGDFIGDIGFFTESPQTYSVACLTVCKTLTISQAAYKMLAQDHPGSVEKILKNLLAKVRHMETALPRSLSLLRAGSVFEGSYQDTSEDLESGVVDSDGVAGDPSSLPDLVQGQRHALTAVIDLVKMHMEKQLDDQTTQLLFAASRGDTTTISLMCEQGFSPDNADYDNRTALMVASMKGNSSVVRLLLRYKANPNLVDMHGTTALLEAVKNSNDDVMDILLANGAQLCMSEHLAASVLCQTVSDGDIVLLKRLLRAGIPVNAADYDKRTAAHIAAAEGNAAALRTLSENGADLTLKDRWKQTAGHEAKRSKGPIKKEMHRTLTASTHAGVSVASLESR